MTFDVTATPHILVKAVMLLQQPVSFPGSAAED